MKKLFLLFIFTFCLSNQISSNNIQNNNSQTSPKKQILTQAMLNRLSPFSMNKYAFNVYSQFGEDGIIEEIFNRLKIKKGFCVEFGACDGILLSNTRHLWEKGWAGVMIEKKQLEYQKMIQNYQNNKNMLVSMNLSHGEKRIQEDILLMK